jgi:hypothetical protein
MNAIGAAVRSRHRDVDHLAHQRVERALDHHDRLQPFPCALEQGRIVRQAAPEIVDEVRLAGGADVVEHRLDRRFRFDLGVGQEFHRRHCLVPSFGSSPTHPSEIGVVATFFYTVAWAA